MTFDEELTNKMSALIDELEEVYLIAQKEHTKAIENIKESRILALKAIIENYGF